MVTKPLWVRNCQHCNEAAPEIMMIASLLVLA
uniref:Uncharacterized protein n=1 Tax=Arundo donax TaxID=35708 RepID=A0A0A9F6T0_ARUDO